MYLTLGCISLAGSIGGVFLVIVDPSLYNFSLLLINVIFAYYNLSKKDEIW